MTKAAISFRCYFPGARDNYTDHRASIPVVEIPKWVEAYRYTHPNCKRISVRIFFDREEVSEDE